MRFLAHLLRPNIIQSPNSTFGIIAHNVPPCLKGGARSKETGSNEPQRLFAHSARSRNKCSGGHTSHDFVTARARCASSTALQLSTSINRGLTAVPKVELYLPLKPSLSDLYWLERQSACRYTPPIRSKKHSDVFHHRHNHCIQSTGSHLLIRYDHKRFVKDMAIVVVHKGVTVRFGLVFTQKNVRTDEIFIGLDWFGFHYFSE